MYILLVLPSIAAKANASTNQLCHSLHVPVLGFGNAAVRVPTRPFSSDFYVHIRLQKSKQDKCRLLDVY